MTTPLTIEPTPCIWKSPNGDCGWKRDESGTPGVKCSTEGCKEYEPKPAGRKV